VSFLSPDGPALVFAATENHMMREAGASEETIVAPNTSRAGSRIAADLVGTPGKLLGLVIGVVLLMTSTMAANAFNPTLPKADAPVSEDCCGTDQDQDHTFRGYTAELWDEAPTVSDLNCPDQDEACLLNEADQIVRLPHLQQALVSRAALWRAQHFEKGPFVAGAAYSTQ
jgi:hypothetical protein